MAREKTSGIGISPEYLQDCMCKKLIKLAEDFYSIPENMEKYRAWHLKEYGCTPEEWESQEAQKRKPCGAPA